MDLGLQNSLLPGDPRLIDHIVGEVKSQGIFDQFRKDALADVDTKPAYQNLRTRVEASVNSFLTKQIWKADLNKNQLRETLRKQISDATYLDAGVERIVDQVVNPKIYSVFMPQIEDVVYKYLGLEKPKREKNGSCGLKDLLPIDLDPVSPESDKNSLKDVSLDSVDADLVIGGDKKKENGEHVEKADDETLNNGHTENSDKIDEIDNPIREGSTPPLPLFQQPEENLLNDSTKSDEKMEEDEEDSPVFEPIDIMNLNESNISNDSHLSGISELTSHRSCSPEFTNEFSRDNFDFSNQDSQFSKVSSDSRLSIVTDFGSSNQASTPISDTPKDDSSKEKNSSKDNFRAIRDEGDKKQDAKLFCDSNKTKENILKETKELSDHSIKSSKTNLFSKELLRDETDAGIKDKSDQKDKDKNRDAPKTKSSKERSNSRDSRSHRDRDKDHKKKSSLSDSKNDNSEKSKIKDRSESGRDPTERLKESKELISTKSKDEKVKEYKDLKDIYKEKIRELREKKELTEKEKLSKENKESSKSSKDLTKKESSKDKKEHRSSFSSSKSRSSKHDSKSVSKDHKNSSGSNLKDKSRRDEKRRDSKEHKNKSQGDCHEKSTNRRSSRSDKDEKQDGKSSQKLSSSSKKESRSHSHSRSSDKSDNKRSSESKDRKRDEKKSKSKDDHPSLRKNVRDRRSSDRDGSNGSSGKGSTDKSNSSPNTPSTTPSTSTLSKGSNNASSNSSSETSNSAEEQLIAEGVLSHSSVDTDTTNEIDSVPYIHLSVHDCSNNVKRNDSSQNELSLPLKKRPLANDADGAFVTSSSSSPINGVAIKKPKFARNFNEARKLMKLRKKLEKQSFLAQYNLEKKIETRDKDEIFSSVLPKRDDVAIVPDDERVQIIEVQAESDNESYPDDDVNHYMTAEERSNVILNNETLEKFDTSATKMNLSEMELSIKESLNYNDGDRNLKDISEHYSLIKNSRNSKYTQKRKLHHKVPTLRQTENYSIKSSSKNPRSDIVYSKSSKKFESSDTEEACLYFVKDDERLKRFTKFLKTLNMGTLSIMTDDEKVSSDELECSELTMAPPQAKRKYSSSPSTDISLHNPNNNNEGHKIIPTTTTNSNVTMYNDENSKRKKRLGRPKKQRQKVNSSSPQSVTNGDHFVMPLSPDSDVSATSEKMPLQLMRDDKSRPRSSQHYTSDDLYKPRPLFVGSSRRNRRSNQS